MFHGHIGNENKKAREIYKENDKQEKKQQHKKREKTNGKEERQIIISCSHATHG